MKFNRGDLVICEYKKINLHQNIKYLRSDGYDTLFKRGFISGTYMNGNYGLMYLVRCDDGQQNYFYEKNINLDVERIRDSKLESLGIKIK